MTEFTQESEISPDAEVFRTRGKAPYVVGYSLLFLIGFLIFLIFTFPFGVLKEAVISQVSQVTGLTIRVKEMSPSFLIGMDATNIKISTPDASAQVEVESLDVTLSFLSLLIGRATVDAELISKNKGSLNLQVSWSIWNLLKEGNYFPSNVELQAKNFELGGIVSLGLNRFSATANDLIKDLLTQIDIQANLDGNVNIRLAVDEPLQSTGLVDLQLKKATFKFSNPNLVLAQQTFKRALLRAELNGGKLAIDSKSGFESQELRIDFKGNTMLRNPINSSILDLGIILKLEGSLKENLGVILSVAGGNDGQLSYQIAGTMDHPLFQGR